MAHFNFVISQNAKWGHSGFYIDCHRMTVPENILLQKSTACIHVTYLLPYVFGFSVHLRSLKTFLLQQISHPVH